MVCSIISIGQTWTNFEDGESMSSVRGKLNTGMTWMYSHISISGKTTGQLIYYDAVVGVWDTIPAAYGYYNKVTSRMVYQGIDLGSSTALRLLSTDASNTLVSTDLNSWIAGTANEVEITDDADGTVTIGLPDDVIITGNLAATTYGSDGSITDVEFLYGNTVTSNIQDQLDVRCLESIFGTSIGTGIILDGAVLKTSLGLQSISGLIETNGGLLYGTADNAYAWLAAGTANYLLQGNGAGAPSFTNAPTVSAANMTSFPTLNQNTTGTAANVSGTPALPDGVTATTQSVSDNSTKLATTAYADAALAALISSLSLDFSNISQMKVTLGGTTVVESGDHEHNQYLLKTGGDISGDITATGTIEAPNLQADLLLKIGTDFKIIIFHDTMCGVKISTTDTVRIVPIR